MPEVKLEPGQFMGHTLRRTDVILHERKFIPIPVRLDEAQKTSGGVETDVTPGWHASLSAGQALAQQAQQHMLQQASPRMVLVGGLDNAINPPVLKPEPFPKAVVTGTPYRAGRSWLRQKLLDCWDAVAKPKFLPGVKSAEKADKLITTDMSAIEASMAAAVWNAGTNVKFPRESGLDEALGQVEQDYHPLRSAYPHSRVERAVPAVRVDAQPSFFLDDTVGKALENSIDSVCATVQGEELGHDVRRMLQAVYRPEGLYRPDDHTIQQQQAWSRGTTASIYTKQTIALNDNWVCDLRHATGVYQAKGRAWLGVFIHGVSTRDAATRGGLPRTLSPLKDEADNYRLNHRGDTMDSLHFDLFVPCEPEIVTEEWGWGEDLQALREAKTANAMRDAKYAQVSAGVFTDNKWDEKAKRHKSAVDINRTQMQINIEAKQLGVRFEKANHERERARQVLYGYAWKALMVGVMECRQLTVEKIK